MKQRSSFCLSILVLFFSRCFAAPGDIDLSFDAGSDIDGLVQGCFKQTNGKWIIIGEFQTVHGVERHNIARLNANGSTDPSFEANFGTGTINLSGVILLPDEKLYVFGNFHAVNGVSRGGIARLNSDGSVDREFLEGFSGADGWIHSALLLPDGKLVIAGGFSSVNGVAIDAFARLNVDGSLDKSFYGGGVGGSIELMAMQPDGKILLAGPFFRFQGTTRSQLVRINVSGSLDSFYGGSIFEPDSAPQVIVPLPDGKALVGGSFTRIGGDDRYGVACLKSDGRLDLTFGDKQSGVPGGVVRAILPQPDGTIVIGGDFAQVSGKPRGGLARLTEMGQLDSSFAENFHANGLNGTQAGISTVTADATSFLIGGGFSHVNGVNRSAIARLHPDLSVDSEFLNGYHGLNAQVAALALQPSSGKLLVVGNFSYYNETEQKFVARLNMDGSRDVTFKNPLTNWSGRATAVAVAPNGKIYVGGIFEQTGQFPHGVAQLAADGAFEKWIVPGLNYGDSVWTVALQADSKLFVGGSFSTLLGQSYPGLARLTTNATLDTSFKPTGLPTGSWVSRILVQPDGKILAAGEVPSQSGRAAFLMRLNATGSRDTNFATGLSGPNNSITAIALKSTNIIVSGWFSQFHGRAVTALAQLTPDGALDADFPGLPAEQKATWVLPQYDGRILFGRLDPFSETISRLLPDGSVDESFKPIMAVANGAIQQSDGRIIVGGNFTALKGIARDYVARLWANEPPRVTNLVVLKDGNFRLTALVDNGASYIIEQSHNLVEGWTEYTRGTSAGSITIDLPQDNNGVGFFRIVMR